MTSKILIVLLALGLVGALIFAFNRGPDEAELSRLRGETRECKSELDELKAKNKQLRAAVLQAMQQPETLRVDDPNLLRLVGRPQKHVGGGGGDLSAAAVVKVVRANRLAFQQCYERALKRNADLRSVQVRLNLAFAVANNGVPHDVRVAPNVDQGMTSCMAAAVRGWRFPSYGGEPVRVEIPVPLVPKE
jgi:hypothetical protein